jgi:APA family basic amino acid/polyamine antiporter
MPRSFRTPLVWITAPLGAVGCLFLIARLPPETWPRLIIWLVIGLVLYFGYAYKHSRNHQATLGK